MVDKEKIEQIRLLSSEPISDEEAMIAYNNLVHFF